MDIRMIGNKLILTDIEADDRVSIEIFPVSMFGRNVIAIRSNYKGVSYYDSLADALNRVNSSLTSKEMTELANRLAS